MEVTQVRKSEFSIRVSFDDATELYLSNTLLKTLRNKGNKSGIRNNLFLVDENVLWFIRIMK